MLTITPKARSIFARAVPRSLSGPRRNYCPSSRDSASIPPQPALEVTKAVAWLSKDIEVFAHRYLYHSPEERKHRIGVIKRLFQLHSTHFPNAQLKLFGSEGSGLHLRKSDMDFTIIPVGEDASQGKGVSEAIDSKIACRALVEMSNMLWKEKMISKGKLIFASPIPVYKCVTAGYFPLSIDFTYHYNDSVSRGVGISGVRLIKDSDPMEGVS
ncbi:hypothetical protein BJ684DRAFT_21023 [Piptocephalis cylindrospora]|uniref:Poly(A) RNA polymerase mitochondrial-like central palm domain-containing protein n=1 Tax=Piptocephalis cylindrospora TaxID=1907219 RepID=A0A4P9Y112_9FUNG|nr:hypothetical protein BJ684DRAFT_21023 [Piptocephalis cylindrospora]|eukprot:RKP12437.1 hypothetical protein BJ684DRAFT_21023 [Piptocephalis cylindrospora]